MSRIARGALAFSVLALTAPAGAAAAIAPVAVLTTPTTTSPVPVVTSPPVVTAPQPVATSPPPPAPLVRGRLELGLVGAFRLGARNVTVTGRPMRVDGVATPFVPGQVVLVKIREGRRLLKSGTFRLKRAGGGTSGRFSVRFVTNSAGNVSISAVHGATPKLLRVAATPQKVDVVVPVAGPGSTGTFVSLIQSRLAALRFAVPQDGVYDPLTQNAVVAYRKLRGFARIDTLDGLTIHGLLNGIGAFPVRFPQQGRHVEADLTDQVLALIDGSQVFRIYPISSGKPSTPTVLGNFHVYRKTPGYLPDGMYYSNFFYTGYAIHGYDPAPTYPASHGCLRLPIDEAINVYNWVQLGTPVDVYYGAN